MLSLLKLLAGMILVQSLVNKFDTKGQLSEKQLFSASAMLTKIEQNKKQRKKIKRNKQENMVSLDVSKIKAILDKTEGLEYKDILMVVNMSLKKFKFPKKFVLVI